MKNSTAVLILFCGLLSANPAIAMEWIKTREGVKIWNDAHALEESCQWTGTPDSEGRAHGKGLLVWFIKEKPHQTIAGEWREGKLVGEYILLESNGNASRRNADDRTSKKVDVLDSRPKAPSEPKSGDLRIISVKGIETRWHWIPAGQFTMGSPPNEKGRDKNEDQVQVKLSNGFWMLETEVTQELWRAVMGTTIEQQKAKATERGLYGAGAKYPMYFVNYEEAVEFCVKFHTLLKANPAATGLVARLPTEAEWEYAARAGTSTRYYWGDRDGAALQYAWSQNAWFQSNLSGGSQPVGQKKENDWGLKDMSGNVREWCSDWYLEKLPGGTDPQGPSSASDRVFRGGCWGDWVQNGGLRSAGRGGISPEVRFPLLGFRLVCSSVGN